MINYLIANGYNYDGTTTIQKISKALASETGWSYSNQTGAVGNTDYPEKRNATGFTGLPAGIREMEPSNLLAVLVGGGSLLGSTSWLLRL